MQADRQKLFSLAAIVVAAVLFGMVIAGGLDLTPRVGATRNAGPVIDQDQPVSVSSGAPDFATLAERVVPAVVSVFNIDVIEPDEQPQRIDPFRFFFGPQQQAPVPGEEREPVSRISSGSGFFISSDGEVLTNYHVIEDADRLHIELVDGTRFEMKVVGKDPETDMALLKVEKPDRDFPYLSLGDSSALRVGEWVMAVGNPLSLDHTVTVGVVSAKGRTLGLGDDRSFENFIQTDAAINFGNSGGPLVNLRGQVMGINTAINARGQNLGFAVPINTARRILPQLREKGEVVRGYLGVMVREIDQRLQEAFGLASRDGALVDDVLPGHAADKAGLEHGDVIIEVNGEKITDTRELIDTVSAVAPGTEIKLKVIRDGKAQSLDAVVEERDRDAAASADHKEDSGGGAVEERAGLEVAELTQRLRSYYRIGEDVDGLVVTKVKPVSPAGFEGLRESDVILEANGAKVTTTEQLSKQIEQVDKGGFLRLYVYRPAAGRSFHAVLELEE